MNANPIPFVLPESRGPDPKDQAPRALPAPSLPVWAIGVISGTTVALLSLAVVTGVLWQQSHSQQALAQERVSQLSAQVASLTARLNDTIATGNDNMVQQRKSISDLSDQVHTGLASLRHSFYTGAQETVAQRENLRALEQRFQAVQDSTANLSATLSLLSTSSRNLQRMLKEHDDQLRNLKVGSVSADGAPLQFVEGGNVGRILPKPRAPSIPRGNDIIAQPLPGSPALLFAPTQ